MSSDLTALIVGTLLAVSAVAFVLYPLFFGATTRVKRLRGESHATDDSAIAALREIEFDRATGKLSDADYAELRKAYGDRALKELRAADSAAALPADPIEARVREYRLTHRECPTCGVRPEADAIYCSTCGSFLDGRCPRCGGDITEPGATFCSSCGEMLVSRTLETSGRQRSHL